MAPKKNRKKVGMNPSRVNGTDSSSDPDVALAKRDQDSVPRTRRTKSTQMKSPIHFHSDELFDLYSDGSGEEYIPETSDDDSDGTDTSEVIDPFSQPKNTLKCLNSWKIDNVIDECLSPTEPNNGSLKQAADRGLSLSRKESSSGMRRKRQRSSSASRPTTQTSGGRSSQPDGRGSTSTLSKNSAAGREQHLPVAASFPLTEDGEAEGSLLIPAVCKRENGSRMYVKKQYCFYCQVGVGKIARHLERAHSDKLDVAQALSFPKGSKQRRRFLEQLRNKGNFAHNVDVLSTGVGELVPRQQPRRDSQAQSFLHCVHCHGLFGKKLLWKHLTICKFNPSRPEKPGKTRARGKIRARALCAFAQPLPPGVKVEFWKLLSNMVQNEVYFVVKSDACIMEYGEHLYNRLGYDVGKDDYVRQKLRELGRFLICSRKTTALKTIEDHIKPENFMHVVQAVKCVAGFDSETNTYKRPSLALKIGYCFTKISEHVERRANVQKNYRAAKDARAFRKLYETRWNELVSAASLRILRGTKWKPPLLLPFTKDVQTLHSYLDEQQQRLQSTLSTEASLHTWAQLVKITLAQVILFNRQRAGEVSKMTLAAYLSPDPSDDVNVDLSDFEKKLCQHLRRIDMCGKEGKTVPVLLTAAMQQALDLLVSKRQECGVLEGNAYLFARLSALSSYRGCDVVRRVFKDCGAKSPESLSSTRLHKQIATLSQVLSLSDTELQQLAGFLRLDIRVDRQFYRRPEGTLQLAQISKVLMALDMGRLSEFKGKTLDDISIDPDENVQVDSVCDSGSQESRILSNQREEDETTMPDVSQMDAAPQEAGHRESPKNKSDRPQSQRRTWTKEEVVAVERHMMSFITSRRVPGKRDCDKCLGREQAALKNRTWSGLKFYIKNRITALQRKD